MPLAAEYEAMFQQLASQPAAPALSELPPAGGREMYRMMRPVEPDLAIGSVENCTIAGRQGDIPLRIYTPAGEGKRPVVVFYHGGGWVIGDLETADAACRDMANGLGAVVVSVDYRLAPEHRFPAAVDDSYDALCWADANRDSLGGDGRLLVTGESAGGNLAAIMCLRARDAAGPAITAQLLLYPVVDADMSRDSYRRNGEGYLLTTDTMQWFWDQYCPVDQRGNPDASPLRATSHANLPPAIVVTAEFDPLCDEGAAYAAALNAAGVAVQHTCYPGLVHDFFATARLFPCSRAAVDDVYATVKRAI
ncbi:MAG: alpha/beta hydrolase [Pseudomonadales bacterium]|nr:alpha/beta hydrolase [Pseudomonadales bacterium]MCP5184386.1 alpha/beta hydrolase [Pseudomonadales bacterium]